MARVVCFRVVSDRVGVHGDFNALIEVLTVISKGFCMFYGLKCNLSIRK